ncbi:HEAT repeat domain-containing protein [Sorangium sp. So ce131]|uniref:HEAT repeat domain-containing protein n=1 Tax=Sorangium sp. So ce131 TaxID=3133282 RepID=UPI003F5D96FB
MRPLVLAGCLAVLIPAAATFAAPRAAAADFDPAGRNKRPKPKAPKPGGGKAGPAARPQPKPEAQPKPDARPQPKPDARPQPKPDAPEAGDTKRGGPSSDALIARYTAIVLSQPSAPFPLQRLAQLYRERDGNLKKLVEEFERRAAQPGADAWASKVVLAGVYKQDGRYEDAIKTYEAAIADRPQDPSAILALAQLEADRGDKARARGHYEKALPLLKVPADVEQTRRTLLALCLDLSDFAGAKAQHDALVKNAQGSLFVKAELGRELAARGHHARAEAEFRELVRSAAGDNRALAPALRDLGQALAKQKKMDEALAVLKRALAVAGSAAGVRSEILLIMTDAFRAEGKLPELIAILEAEKGQDFQRLATLGALHEETGDVDKAIAIYRRALAIDGKHIDTRLRLVHLLQTAGELDTAIREYELLIRAAPGNADFVFELCETLIQRGDRPKALALLAELEGRVANEPETLAAVADFYERVEEKDRALKVLQRLAGAAGGDPSHLVDLGDRYFQAGDKKKALETWARIKQVVPSRARAAATLGEVYLDHDMVPEALAALREAAQLEPANSRYKKALAIALERTASSLGNASSRYSEARELWEELLAAAGNDKMLAREARTHIVSLWALTHELPGRVAPLSARFGASPPDLEAGRLLAEVQRKLHRLPDAEATLRRLVQAAPGDEDALLALERVLVLQQNLLGAIDVLGKLVEVNPKRAREFYQRMAQYAAELYRDDDAIRYAARAVELSPEDASGHQKLGDMYRRRQDFQHAIAEYRQALAKNDRLFPVYFDLAELLLTAGQADEADRLFRRVVRASNDEELVARAARMSMQVNLGRGSLEVLERELLPVAVGNPQKPLYRRLLVELYGAMTFPLMQKVRGEGRAASAEARAELARIGARAVKPLLDALADEKESQQKIAIEVLAYVENKSAGPALYNFATGQADKGLRARAMIACGALRDPAMLGRYEQMLAPKDASTSVLPNDAVAVAATWSVARLVAGGGNGGNAARPAAAKAEALLARLLASPAPEVRAIAAVGLGLTRDRKHAAALSALARAPEAGALPRAAAVRALGELGGGGEGPALFVALADSSEPELRRAALLTLARLGGGGANGSAGGGGPVEGGAAGGAGEAIAAGAFSSDEGLRAAAASAAVAFTRRVYPRTREPLPVPDGALTVREVLAGLDPDPFGPEDRAAALVALGPALQKAAVAAVATSPERALVVAEAILSRRARGARGEPGKAGEGGKGGEAAAGGAVAFGLAPFTDGRAELGPELKKQVEATVEGIAAAVVGGFVALVRHPAIEVRTRAVELLATRPEPEAQAAVIDALGDPEEGVRRAALSALGAVRHGPTIAAVSELLRSSSSWPLRVRAAEALGRLGASGAAAGGASAGGVAAGGAGAGGGRPSPIAETLGAAARSDAYALVREAAARALTSADRAAAVPVLRQLAARDPEPRVREAAAELMRSAAP